MVYKLTAPEVSSIRKTLLGACLTYGLLAGVTAAVLGVHLDASAVVVLVVSLFAALLTVLGVYAHLAKGIRTMQGQGDWFVTVTDAGLMLEKPQEGTTAYMTWEMVARVFFKNGILYVTLKNGLSYYYPLASLSPERAQELYAYCAEQAGKPVPVEKQMQPPAEMLTPLALPCAEGVAARQEGANEMQLQRAPFVRWVCLVALAVMMSGLAIQVWAWIVTGESDIVGVVVALVLSLFFLRGYLLPGWSMRKWVQHEAASNAYIHQGKILVQTPGVAWTLLPVSLVCGARELRHSYAYAVRGGGVLGISRSVPPPAGLPRPVPVKRWTNWLALSVSAVVVPALVVLGCWCWLSLPDELDADAACERGEALQTYLEELLPPAEYPGAIDWCALYISEADGSSSLSIDWESGLELYIELPPVVSPRPEVD